ncbi:protein dispatched homolog 1-like isoform X2 [Physella acuta]|uniref:protein dispatched homolog 1-like isoform X2 n=1 Tax=Physella acuta TaxID=109671 RepID=UPI0027DB26BC|nr:protein dispatched homolog 1-like isoform X2 [Physella acuta]XP_059161064.1 protein dispatched homolog 1-like isoform X2 [Physella acuta]
MCRWYARILSHYPYVILLVVFVVVATCLVVTVTCGQAINFDDPLAGFEPRGTELADRLITFHNLINNVGGKANLLPSGFQLGPEKKGRKKGKSSKKSSTKSPQLLIDDFRRRRSDIVDEGFLENVTTVEKNIFCGVPEKTYARIVVTSADNQNLFNEDDLRSICQLEHSYFRQSKDYKDVCLRNEADGSCCRAWSLGSYIAVLVDKPSCDNITSDDVSSIYNLLVKCSPYYVNHSLRPNCDGDGEEWYYSSSEYSYGHCSKVPAECTKFNAAYHILNYLTDSNFLYSGKSSDPLTTTEKSTKFLKYSTLFLPVYAGPNSEKIFQHLDNLPRNFQGITVVGAEFGLKYFLFEKYLISDSVWLGVVCGAIFLAMWVYTTSLFITVMAFLSMFWAVEVAYFLYSFVFKIKFFPYMNMVTFMVMVGIGADDLFIYCKVWHLAKSEKNNGVLEKLVADTLRHTVLSMLVTSLTTAAAFYANYISDITAIRCFSVYAGTCIMINFILTITWLPASIMLQERWLRCCVGLTEKNCLLCYVCKVPYQLYYILCDWSRIFFEKLLPCLVIKFRYVWIVIFGGLWIGSIVVIFFYPRLKLANNHKFQVFSSDHLLERYDFELADLFEFEKRKDADDYEFPITVVWGVLAKDNGDPLDPDNKGTLTFDPGFDLASSNAQRWILEFCSRLRRTDFYQQTPGLYVPDCPLENFVYNWMTLPCDSSSNECCNQTVFPFHRSKMLTCLPIYIHYLNLTPGVSYNNQSPGPRFNNGKISAFFIQFRSNHTFSYAYEEVHSFYMKVNQWVNEELLRAPVEMRRGWFVSNLQFYDLHSSLALGTPLALGVSLSVVALVSFFTTLNVLISIYALTTVAATICVTLASLVLMDWELDVLESVVITVAVGLAIDLTLHYGVAFRLAPDVGREMRVITSLGRMGSPVAMAAFTTILAGSLMMPSTVLAYKKFGTFLLLLVSIAWLYSTFFFQALLRIMGPNGGCGQFHWPASDCCTPDSEHVDKTIYALSESTLSSSSTSTREHNHAHNHSYTHELEPLTYREHSPRQMYYQHSAHLHSCPDTHRHQRLNPACNHHNLQRTRRKGDYTAVRTNLNSSDVLSDTQTKQDSLVVCPSPKPSHDSLSENVLNVPSESPASTHSNHDISSDTSEYDNKLQGSNSDVFLSDATTTELFPHSIPLHVA